MPKACGKKEKEKLFKNAVTKYFSPLCQKCFYSLPEMPLDLPGLGFRV